MKATVGLLIACIVLGLLWLSERADANSLREERDGLDSELEALWEARSADETDFRDEVARLQDELETIRTRGLDRAYVAGALSVCRRIYEEGLAAIVSTEDGNVLSFGECKFFFVGIAPT